MVDAITGASGNLSAMQVAENYDMAIAKKVMDVQEVAGQELNRMLASVPVQTGSVHIDSYA
jgi:hypothetical protein